MSRIILLFYYLLTQTGNMEHFLAEKWEKNFFTKKPRYL
jgi:hypothetical protein